MHTAIDAKAVTQVGDWREAVQTAAGMLVDLDAAEPRYVQACLDSLDTNGPYIVLTPGVALAHARPEQGATGLGVALLRLEQPVSFGHPTNDPVDLVFAFCTPEPGGHIALLRRLAVSLAQGVAGNLRDAPEEELHSILSEAVNDD